MYVTEGQVAIPKDVRDILGIESGDRVTFIVENGNVRIVNTAIYAMQMLQKELEGKAEKVGLATEEDINGASEKNSVKNQLTVIK